MTAEASRTYHRPKLASAGGGLFTSTGSSPSRWLKVALALACFAAIAVPFEVRQQWSVKNKHHRPKTPGELERRREQGASTGSGESVGSGDDVTGLRTRGDAARATVMAAEQGVREDNVAKNARSLFNGCTPAELKKYATDPVVSSYPKKRDGSDETPLPKAELVSLRDGPDALIEALLGGKILRIGMNMFGSDAGFFVVGTRSNFVLLCLYVVVCLFVCFCLVRTDQPTDDMT